MSSLAEWLQTAAPQIGAPVNLDKFSSGQSNPTYRLQTNLGEQDGRFVLRTQPAGLLLKSAHAVDREFRVMKALNKTAVPVPGMIAACDDPDVIGMKFFIMREIDGDTLFDPALAGYSGADRHALFHAKIDVLAALAQLDPIALGLEGFGKPSGYIDRQLGTWDAPNIVPVKPSRLPRWNFCLPNCQIALIWKFPAFASSMATSGWIIC